MGTNLLPTGVQRQTAGEYVSGDLRIPIYYNPIHFQFYAEVDGAIVTEISHVGLRGELERILTVRAYDWTPIIMIALEAQGGTAAEAMLRNVVDITIRPAWVAVGQDEAVLMASWEHKGRLRDYKHLIVTHMYRDLIVRRGKLVLPYIYQDHALMVWHPYTDELYQNLQHLAEIQSIWARGLENFICNPDPSPYNVTAWLMRSISQSNRKFSGGR